MRTFIKEKLRTTSTAQFVIIATVITLLLSTLLTTITSFVTLGRLSLELLLANTVIGLIIPLIVAPFMTQIIKEATISEQANQELKRENIERKRLEDEATQRALDLQVINELAIECATAPPKTDITKLIAEKLRDITNALGVGVTVYDPIARTLTTKHIAVSGQILNAANQLIGYNLIGMVTRVTPEMEDRMLTGTVETFADLSEITFGSVPKAVAVAIKKTIGVGSFTGMALSYGGKLIGTTIIAMRDGQPDPHIETYKTMAHVAAVSIQRNHLEREREKLVTELKAKNQELEEFTHTVSHDLKAPLITIKGFLGLLEKDVLEGNVERTKHDIVRINEATGKMHRFLNELLELSRIGRIVNPPKDVPFSSIVQDALDAVHGRLKARNVRVNLSDGLPIVFVDQIRIVQVVQNLLDNAAKFMGEQSHPSIEIGYDGKDDEGKSILYVKDNGKGIADEQLENVFRLFQKLDISVEGTGVGLALVKRIIDVHDGRVWITSKGLGHGTTVWFTLPTSDANTVETSRSMLQQNTDPHT